ncbi:aromatic acid exporter family protein [Bacillus sp. PS06]|uniref:aromatic acid exporter family protein n=1 Tax=Bacillus sp. PS06 TaxID=2764176 RepID=UPI0017802747|nr:aromatic acid exporter family protein [Bacillus sp. PS06]MBD8070373.1 aromatic acid exporter family protein [Bacillus sp. PS06]
MFKIGYRTIKTAIGAALAIALAQLLNLEFYTSAGILTILCVQVTKKKSLRSSLDRLIACFLGMLFSFVFFELIGYYAISVGLLLLFLIPTIVKFKATEGVASSSVIILHIFSTGNFTFDLLLNEIAIVFIGIGVALIVNLYMPSVEKNLKEYQVQLEVQFGKIFKEMVSYLRTGESSWDGKEITETEELLQKAKSLAFRDVENHFSKLENNYYHYFRMREKQFEILERMLPIVTSITHSVEQGEIIADFIEEVSDSIHPGNTAIQFLKKLGQMRKSFEAMELPTSREEFEARAGLLQFLNEMEHYLIIKQSFKGLS